MHAISAFSSSRLHRSASASLRLINNPTVTMSNLEEIAKSSDGQDKGKKVINVLCLHGKGNCGSTFQKMLAPLEESLNSSTSSGGTFNFDYLTAPFRMDAEADSDERMQWWTLPPGIRSFNAKKYEGFEASKELVNNALHEKDYQFICGHSQGAILTSALLTMKESDNIFTPKSNTNENATLLGFILNGNAWPNPYSENLENHQHQNEEEEISKSEEGHIHSEYESRSPQVLFVVGESDKINPPKGALRVRDAMERGGLQVNTCHHPGGHAVPIEDDKALQEMVDWIKISYSLHISNVETLR